MVLVLFCPLSKPNSSFGARFLYSFNSFRVVSNSASIVDFNGFVTSTFSSGISIGISLSSALSIDSEYGKDSFLRQPYELLKSQKPLLHPTSPITYEKRGQDQGKQ